MRILHVLDAALPGHDSYAARSSAVLREQRALGWQTLHVLTPAASQQTPGHCGLSFYRCSPRPRYLPAPLGNLWSLQRQLRRVGRLSRPDLIQVHSPAYLGLASMGNSSPLLLELRGLFPEREDLLERLLLPRLAGIVCTSHALARKLASCCRPGLPIAVVPNGVHPGAAQGTRRIADFRHFGQPLLGLLGPCTEAEGCALALQALARLRNTFPDVALIFAGKHAEQQVWRELAERFGVSRHFHAFDTPSAAWLGAC